MKLTTIPAILLFAAFNISCSQTDLWDKTVVAIIKTPSITVKYDPNGATGGNTPVDSGIYRNGSMAPVSDNTLLLVKTGSYFTGWNTQADGAGTTYTVGQYIITGTADITLYAKWVNTTASSITFSPNGATGGSAPVYCTYYEPGQCVAIPGNTSGMYRAGYSFTGWNTASNGSGTTYTMGETFSMPVANTTLWAMWAVSETYTVKYYLNGADSGIVPLDSTNYIYGQNATVLANSGNLARTGFPFGGWNTMPDGSGTDYAPSAVIPMNSNLNLYAKWITYALGNTGPAGGLIFYINPNYIADGWRYLEAAPGDQSSRAWGTFSFTVQGADGTAIGTGKHNTLDIITGDSAANKAADECNSYSLVNGSITYNDWFLPSKDELNQMYINLKVPGIGGFIDDSWWCSSENDSYTAWGQYFLNGSPGYDNKYALKRVRAIRAFRSLNPTYVTVYNSNGATGGTVPTNLYHYEQSQTVNVANNSGSLVQSGHTFLGWNTQADGNGTDRAPGSSFLMGTGNVVLYAKWANLPSAWDNSTEPKVTSHVQNTSVRIDWAPLQNAVKYEIWYVTNWSPLTETKFDETTNPYYITTQYLTYNYRIKAIDASSNIIDIRLIYQGASLLIPVFLSGTYSDNFDDGIVSSNYYIKNPAQTSEAGGYFQLSQNITDNGPYMYIGYDTGGKRYIHIGMKWFQHRTEDYYYGGIVIYSYNNNLDIISVANNHDIYYGYYGTGVGYSVYNEQAYLPCTSQRDVLDLTEYFDVWFTRDIYLDLSTGSTEVKLNGISLGISNTGIILNNKIVIRIDPVQWWTGSYVQIDDLLIESSVTPY